MKNGHSPFIRRTAVFPDFQSKIFYRIIASAKLYTAPNNTLIGTATIKRRLNNIFRSSSFGVEPRIREPPDENGLIALDCAPIMVQAKSAEEVKPAEAARFGISGNRAGATTPVVELKKLMIAPTILNAIGTSGFGTLEPIQVDNASMVPASTATAISIPAPAIIIR